jgi:hypothetical protein
MDIFPLITIPWQIKDNMQDFIEDITIVRE